MGGRRLTEEDFDKVKDLQAHGYKGAEASRFTKWSESAISRMFHCKTWREYISTRKPRSVPVPEPPSPPEDNTRVIGIDPLLIALDDVRLALIDNTKSNYVLRRDLTQSLNDLVEGIDKVFGNKTEDVPDQPQEELIDAQSNNLD